MTQNAANTAEFVKNKNLKMSSQLNSAEPQHTHPLSSGSPEQANKAQTFMCVSLHAKAQSYFSVLT